MTVTRGGETVGGTSIMGLMMLARGARHDHQSGGDRQRGQRRDRARLSQLVESGFGEED